MSSAVVDRSELAEKSETICKGARSSLGRTNLTCHRFSIVLEDHPNEGVNFSVRELPSETAPARNRRNRGNSSTKRFVKKLHAGELTIGSPKKTLNTAQQRGNVLSGDCQGT